MRKLLCLLGPILLTLLTACQKESDVQPDPLGPDAWLPLKVGNVSLESQIVLTQSEQRKGLMHRDTLGENQGMLFPYQSPRRLSFWMANTRIPLDIGFFDSTGLLCEVHRMVPFDTTPTQSKGTDLQFALEMNSGWFARNGLYPGVRMDMALLVDALRKRGQDPVDLRIKTE
jgi:uncharacterized membrane protein (UPF0127 family)